MKRCYICLEIKPLNEYYYRSSRNNYTGECKECIQIKKQEWELKNPIRKWFMGCKTTSKRRGIPFHITWKQCEFLWSGRCAETGVEFTFNNSANSPTFDRFDPDGVYEINNVRIVTNRVNAARGRNPLPLYREFM